MSVGISVTVALTAGLLLAAVGIVAAPGAALGGLAFALLVAAGTATFARDYSGPRSSSGSRHSRRAGLIAGGGTLSLWLLVTGLVALLGQTTGVIVLALLASAAVLFFWWRAPSRFAAWTAIRSGQQQPPRSTPSSPTELSTNDLCLAWQHSQRLLLEASTATVRCDIVSTRQRLLDEMERRDGAGFTRWLATGACAGTDPSSYLTTT